MLRTKFVHLFKKYVLSADYVWGILFTVGETKANNKDPDPAVMELRAMSLRIE